VGAAASISAAILAVKSIVIHARMAPRLPVVAGPFYNASVRQSPHLCWPLLSLPRARESL
jgi:hypothetical protein